MKLSILSALFILLYGTAMAQDAGKISGQVDVASNKAAETATVSLLKAKDSAIVKLSVPNKQGIFVFENLPHGKYLVTVTAAGHEKIYSPVVEILADKKNIQLPLFNLVASSQTLGGVTVTAKRPLIEQKIDRTIVNVDASITNVGTTAMEVLEKSPGITVDNAGNIGLKGKNGVMVMIDGRPTQLGGEDLANMLRNMSSNQLDQIEIMTNPPAKYDAAGNAGIINIKTKKIITAGYNGAVSLGYTQGRYPKTEEGFNFNYREGKVNIFTNLSHNYRKGFEVLTIQRNLRNDNNVLTNYFDQEADNLMTGNAFNAKLGLDYFANKRTTLGVVLNGFTRKSEVNKDNETYISDPSKVLQTLTIASVDNNAQWKNFSTNLYFRRLLDASGKELTSDFDYITYDAKNDQFMINSYFNATGNSIKKSDTLQGSLPQNIKIYSGRIDYLQPLKKGSRFEAGIKSSIVRTDNNVNYDSIQYGNIVHDFNRSNHFIYEENINAAYVNLSTSLSKKLNAQFGLRLENTNAKGVQKTTGQDFKRNYTQLFPTAYFQYKADEKNNFGFNYGRRVRRPNYASLNPFIRFIDRYTYSQGNPDLKAQTSDNIELSHTYNNFLTTTLNYTSTTDIIEQVIEQKGEEAYSTQANIASSKQFGLAISANHSITKWWMNSINVNVFNNNYKGFVNKVPISFSATSYVINGAQQFKLSKTVTGELSGRYRSGWTEGVMQAQPVGMLAVGLSKQIMKNKGSVRLTVRDIFYTQKFKANIKYGNVDAAFQEIGDSRVVAVGFSYRFSKGKTGTQRRRTTGSADEEQNRVGN